MMYPINDTFTNYQEEPSNLEVFDCFEDKLERKKFIKKTLGLFFFGILTTFGSCLAFKYVPNSINFIYSEAGEALTILSLVTTGITMFVTMCCSKLLRKKPVNYIIYILFVLSVSWNVGISTHYFSNDIVLATVGTTCGITFSLLLYSVIITTDFTDYIEYFLVMLFGVIFMSIINYFLTNTVLQIILSGVGCVLFSLFIVYDMQMIVGQKHIKHKYFLDDYILAAMSLYLDVINIFLYSLQSIYLIEN